MGKKYLFILENTVLYQIAQLLLSPISKKDDTYDNLFYFNNIEHILELSKTTTVFVIGGAQLIQHIPINEIDNIFETRIFDTFDCDVFLFSIRCFFLSIHL